MNEKLRQQNVTLKDQSAAILNELRKSTNEEITERDAEVRMRERASEMERTGGTVREEIHMMEIEREESEKVRREGEQSRATRGDKGRG